MTISRSLLFPSFPRFIIQHRHCSHLSKPCPFAITSPALRSPVLGWYPSDWPANQPAAPPSPSCDIGSRRGGLWCARVPLHLHLSLLSFLSLQSLLVFLLLLQSDPLGLLQPIQKRFFARVEASAALPFSFPFVRSLSLLHFPPKVRLLPLFLQATHPSLPRFSSR